MRAAINYVVISAVALLTLPAAQAQRDYPLVIDEVAVGLPPGRFTGDKDAATGKPIALAKRNRWAPVALSFTLARDIPTGAKLRIDSLDGDDLKTTLVVPLTKSFANYTPGAKFTAAELGASPLVRSGDRTGDVTLTVLSDDGRDKQLAETFHVRFQPFRDATTYLVLGLGTRLPGFELPSDTANKQTARGPLRNGRVETANYLGVLDMPDQWFGYEAADLVVLTTGATPANFLNDLFGENVQEVQRVRRDALLEWVRRGGKLLISVGSNAPTLAQLPAFQAILPAKLRLDPPIKMVPELPLYARLNDFTINGSLRAKNEGNAPFAVANLSLGGPRPPRMLMPNPDDKHGDPDAVPIPVVLQAAYGLGRVSLVTFDLDQSPYLDYNNKAQFWDYLVRECGSARAALVPPGNATTSYNYAEQSEDELLAALRGHVDTFEGVQVISFGWVALFIVLYTLLIGPVEYFFLKYVLRRLELTWVTFPLIVVSVSAAAYFTAYAIKGNDLKVNKVDLVDVDLAGKRVYGRSWLTIFSPRIDNYTVTVRPRDGWVAPPTLGTPETPPLVGWMAGGAGGSSSIVSRGYTYHADPSGRVVADQLDRVPIQVWSTKAFEAEWSGTLDPAAPLLVADLFHPPGDATLIAGSFTSNIPVETLQNPYLIYAGKVLQLPAIQPGQRVTVPAGSLKEKTGWFADNAASLPVKNDGSMGYSRRNQNGQGGAAAVSLWGTLFHERSAGTGRPLGNSSLRSLDQSWRVDEKARGFDEAILIASVAPPIGPAEPILTDPTGASPTVLSLRGPGTPARPREAVPGTLRQETYIRVVIPVRPAGKQ